MAYRYMPISDEKLQRHTELDGLRADHPRAPLRTKLFQRFVPAVLLASAVLLLFRTAFICHGRYHLSKDARDLTSMDDVQNVMGSNKVSLEAHIMSKCPDARDCLQQLVLPTMEKVSDKVDFKLSYIGRVDKNSDEVSCMHGPSECLGNMIELCAARIYPDPKIFLGFTNCMTSNYSEIPERDLVENCCMEHGVDFQRVNRCLSDEGHGNELLRQSFLRSQEHNVTKSCTVRLAGDVRCIRDGGKWYDCPGGSDVDDLVRDIENLYAQDLSEQ